MASDFHIKLTGVQGESTHKDHKDEIEIFAWNWNVSNPSSFLSGGGSGKGKAQPGELQFVHNYDKASPVLAKRCVDGTHFDELVLSCHKSGEGQALYLTITLKEAFITAVAPGGASGGDITESVTVSYKDVEFVYKPQSAKGDPKGDVQFGWDIESTETR